MDAPAAIAVAALALAAAQPDRPGLVRSALWLWIGLAFIGVVVVLGAWVIVTGMARRAGGSRPARRRRPIKDAWAEAGRRAPPLDQGEFYEGGEGEEGPGEDGGDREGPR